MWFRSQREYNLWTEGVSRLLSIVAERRDQIKEFGVMNPTFVQYFGYIIPSELSTLQSYKKTKRKARNGIF